MVLARDFAFESEPLARAIRGTFARRGTPLPGDLPTALTDVFAEDPAKLIQWTAFVRKANAKDAGTLGAAIHRIRSFAERPLMGARRSLDRRASWPPGGPWSA
jgi:hypothetical protein